MVHLYLQIAVNFVKLVTKYLAYTKKKHMHVFTKYKLYEAFHVDSLYKTFRLHVIAKMITLMLLITWF